MNSERKAFEEFFFKTNAYKRIQHHIDMCASGYHQELHDVFQMDDFNESDYANETVQTSWEAWQASAQRQGYKLVPVEPTQKMIEAAIIERSKHGRTDSCIYKAMIGAVE